MLANRIIRKEEILNICRKSADISCGDEFSSVVLAESDALNPIPAGTIQCRAISDNEALFSVGDGQVYFSIADGWGVKDGVLYGLALGTIYFDFGHPTTPETIAQECSKSCGTYRSFAGAMAHHSRRETLDKISSFLTNAR